MATYIIYYCILGLCNTKCNSKKDMDIFVDLFSQEVNIITDI